MNPQSLSACPGAGEEDVRQIVDDLARVERYSFWFSRMSVCPCAGEEDVRQIVDDLASLGAGGSDPAANPGAKAGAEGGAQPERWQWLRPWAWISGLGWRSRRREADVALDVHVRGAGLENATTVRARPHSRSKEVAEGFGRV